MNDSEIIMREVGDIGKIVGSLQTIINFVFWVSTERPELFTEYIEYIGENKK